ncbi:HlyD family efflux transporter periplasmic adaptor subunit [uncultured Nocardioides sp.]|uniref:HlyD family efflux transporter periplasmic adaptor subunit n=1 Tax=uncultured Nocardioides sp. TaxID=198441 RepID=UPI002614E05B|nr:HlyD family efflux transporter periplasmic adaptor subunit [uncultured Nocardioides sp.]
MNVLTRLKYLVGMLLVVGAVAALALSMNQRISTVHDVSATVRTDDYTVGTPYAGTVVARKVDVGDQVGKGDPLFVVRSTELAREIAKDAIEPESSPYDIRDDTKVVIRATSAGKVSEVQPIEGAYVAANSTLAQVQEQGTSYVQADFRLTPKQYALMRGADDVTVRLPDEQSVPAEIDRIGVRTDGASAATRLRVVSPALNNRGLFASGTPVDVDVALRRDGLAESVRSLLTGLLTPGGAG